MSDTDSNSKLRVHCSQNMRRRAALNWNPYYVNAFVVSRYSSVALSIKSTDSTFRGTLGGPLEPAWEISRRCFTMLPPPSRRGPSSTATAALQSGLRPGSSDRRHLCRFVRQLCRNSCRLSQKVAYSPEENGGGSSCMSSTMPILRMLQDGLFFFPPTLRWRQ
jgi:hypothetical protein